MDQIGDPRRPDTFVVRLVPGQTEQISGLIHNVRTGERRRFEGLEGLGVAIEDLIRGETGSGEAE
jgi:hypothetical protein